jgi:hypothetical protein
MFEKWFSQLLKHENIRKSYCSSLFSFAFGEHIQVEIYALTESRLIGMSR